MAYETRDNTGALFPNKNRQSDKHPSLTGSLVVEGVEYFLDGWTNLDRNGNKYISVKVKRKDKQPAPQSYAQASGGRPASARSFEDEDGIPF